MRGQFGYSHLETTTSIKEDITMKRRCYERTSHQDGGQRDHTI